MVVQALSATAISVFAASALQSADLRLAFLDDIIDSMLNEALLSYMRPTPFTSAYSLYRAVHKSKHQVFCHNFVNY